MGDSTANENSDSSEEQKNDIISNSSEGENQKKQRTRKIVKKELPIEENLTQDSSNDKKEEKIDKVSSEVNTSDNIEEKSSESVVDNNDQEERRQNVRQERPVQKFDNRRQIKIDLTTRINKTKGIFQMKILLRNQMRIMT
jgi:hypothetical protein